MGKGIVYVKITTSNVSRSEGYITWQVLLKYAYYECKRTSTCCINGFRAVGMRMCMTYVPAKPPLSQCLEGEVDLLQLALCFVYQNPNNSRSLDT